MKVLSQETEIFKQAIAASSGSDTNYVQTIITPAKMPINGSLETIRLDNIECIIGFDTVSTTGSTNGGIGTVEYLVGDNELLVTNDFTSNHTMYYQNKITPLNTSYVGMSGIIISDTEIQKANSLIIKPQIAVLPTFRTQYKRSGSIAVFVIMQVTYSKIKLTSDEFIALFAA
jgi:hypothetical protein